ncbi:FadR/GntR family transcriptional regulator [Paracandidimonas soli]|uniref:GntR family transcriptional regulator n=1 Tax=Paracandidimonas soli TaxID=1917182 RepID=A0A4R3USM5_9BURK|nr:FadR/GntR family transcriptional regulator [Paracandidimonas soli]TCU93697.1 GntR family transcriptional regulator [Paracandidimonas soli]
MKKKTTESGSRTELAAVGVARPDQRQRLGDKLYGLILEQIMSGELKVGDRLASEHEISRQHDISRPVVREALLRLRADGLITAHQGMGTFVTHQPEVRLKTFDDAGNVAFYLRAQELRQTIEGDAARLAALRRSRAQLKAIETAHRKFNALVQKKGATAEADLAFHMSIAHASGNELYASVLESVLEPVQGFMRLALNLTRTGTQQRSIMVMAEHEAIVQAIAKQDSEQARIAMKYHLGQARGRLVGQSADAMQDTGNRA